MAPENDTPNGDTTSHSLDVPDLMLDQPTRRRGGRHARPTDVLSDKGRKVISVSPELHKKLVQIGAAEKITITAVMDIVLKYGPLAELAKKHAHEYRAIGRVVSFHRLANMVQQLTDEQKAALRKQLR